MVAIAVMPNINKGVCVPVSPFFINRINRGPHSSETAKVCTYQTAYQSIII